MTVTKEWIPDANLRRFVRKQLNLPDEVPFTRQDMKRLMELTALDDQITILTDLYQINLIRRLQVKSALRGTGTSRYKSR